MKAEDPKVLEARKRKAEAYFEMLRSDFPLYAGKLLKIRTKDGSIVKLKLNKAQVYFYKKCREQLDRTGYIRVIVLKGRQQGLSTIIAAWMFHQTVNNPGQKTLVVANIDETATSLFDMTKRFWENLPEPLRPQTRASNKKELIFAKKYSQTDQQSLDSRYMVVTAGGRDPARGETIQNAHLSEMAFWPAGCAEDNFNGMMKAVPKGLKGTMVFIESTANGVSGVFYSTWKAAEEGVIDFMPIFIPWFWSDEYQSAIPKGFTLTPDEQDVYDRYKNDGLTMGAMVWRREEVNLNGLDKFHQEYPCCAEEAFLTTGAPVFDGNALLKQREKQSHECVHYGHIKGKGFAENSRGSLRIWATPAHGRRYYIGVDVAAGIKGRDYSVATVLDDERRIVAVYRAHVEPDYLADVVCDLGHMYNTALVIVERNNHGYMTCSRLYRDLHYQNFYVEQTLDKTTQKYTQKLGFWTGEASKVLIVDNLRAAVREGLVQIVDPLTITELTRYVVHENGSMGAEHGKDRNGEDYHDDTVMALCLANYVWRGKPRLYVLSSRYHSKVP